MPELILILYTGETVFTNKDINWALKRSRINHLSGKHDKKAHKLFRLFLLFNLLGLNLAALSVKHAVLYMFFNNVKALKRLLYRKIIIGYTYLHNCVFAHIYYNNIRADFFQC